MTLIRDPLVEEVIGCAIAVHRALGAGLLEGANERCLAIEFRHRQISYASQVAVPLRYRGVDAGCAYRVDFLVEGRLVVEVKSVERLLPIHTAQVLTYLHLLDVPQGLLINFNGEKLKDGLKSVLNKRHANYALRSHEAMKNVLHEE
jgi:GxxExxY protein